MNQDIDYSRYYKHWHNDSFAHAKKQSRTYGQYLDLLSLNKTSSILDLGCGMGFFVLAASDRGYKNLLGIDSSAQQIAVGRSHNLPVEHVPDTSRWLMESTKKFDAIFMFDVLEHIPVSEQIDVVRALHDALAPGGVLFIRVPNASSTFAGRFRWGDWTHYCSFSEHSLDFVLYNAGFRDITVREDFFGKYPIWMPRPSVQGMLRAFYYGVRRLQAIAEFGREEGREIPLTINILGIAKKES